MKTSSSSHSPVTALYLQRRGAPRAQGHALGSPPPRGQSLPAQWALSRPPPSHPGPPSLLKRRGALSTCPQYAPYAPSPLDGSPGVQPVSRGPGVCSRSGNAHRTRTEWASPLTPGLRSKRRVPRRGGRAPQPCQAAVRGAAQAAECRGGKGGPESSQERGCWLHGWAEQDGEGSRTSCLESPQG